MDMRTYSLFLFCEAAPSAELLSAFALSSGLRFCSLRIFAGYLMYISVLFLFKVFRLKEIHLLYTLLFHCLTHGQQRRDSLWMLISQAACTQEPWAVLQPLASELF